MTTCQAPHPDEGVTSEAGGMVLVVMRKQTLLDSGDSWMYPYQRAPMGNPYISPIYPYIVGVYGLLSPRIAI